MHRPDNRKRKSAGLAGIAAALIVMIAAPSAANAAVLKLWQLTNKSPGALGYDYGLRLNKLDEVGGSKIMIFDFEHGSAGGVTMSLIEDDVTNDLRLELTGQAYGARYQSGVGYSSTLAGLYDIDFTWFNVTENTAGFAYVAENGISTYTVGSGSGDVMGTSFSKTIYDWSGQFTRTLDIKDPAGNHNPDASGWLTYNPNGDHPSDFSGDFGFSMIELEIPPPPDQDVPAPAPLALLAIGLTGMLLRRKRNG